MDARKQNPDQQIVALPNALAVGADYGLTVMNGSPPSAYMFALYILLADGRVHGKARVRRIRRLARDAYGSHHNDPGELHAAAADRPPKSRIKSETTCRWPEAGREIPHLDVVDSIENAHEAVEFNFQAVLGARPSSTASILVLADDRAYYADDHLVVKPPENKVWRVFYLGLIYKNITICVDLKSPIQMKAENDTAGGVSFWVTDFDNNYFARVFPDGSYSISRLVESKVIAVVSKTKIDAVNKGPGAQNRLKIELNGLVGTLYINDVKVREFRGQPPANGSSFGLYADSEAGQRSAWGFTGIVVVEP